MVYGPHSSTPLSFVAPIIVPMTSGDWVVEPSSVQLHEASIFFSATKVRRGQVCPAFPQPLAPFWDALPIIDSVVIIFVFILVGDASAAAYLCDGCECNGTAGVARRPWLCARRQLVRASAPDGSRCAVRVANGCTHNKSPRLLSLHVSGCVLSTSFPFQLRQVSTTRRPSAAMERL